MQNPNEDTDWNDALRRHGILPQKELEITEDQIENMVDSVVKRKTEGKPLHEMNLDELADKEDDEDDRILEIIRQQRIREMKVSQESANFGDIREISANEYVEQVTNAGEGTWVVLHLYKSFIPLCALINKHMIQLARKFPAAKFLKSVSTNCIQNYPDKNLPTIFVYHGGEMKGKLIGPHAFGGMDLKQDALEWMLSQIGVIETTLEGDPQKKFIHSNGEMKILSRDRRNARDSDSDSDDD